MKSVSQWLEKNILDSIINKLDDKSKNKSNILQQSSSKNDNILSSQNQIYKDNIGNLAPIVNENKIDHPIKKKRRRSGEF